MRQDTHLQPGMRLAMSDPQHPPRHNRRHVDGRLNTPYP
jgi:hypothetical protein